MDIHQGACPKCTEPVVVFMSAAQHPTAMKPEPVVGGSFRVENGVAHFVTKPDRTERLYHPHVCARVFD